jgi:DNA-binding NtrC family response regulator
MSRILVVEPRHILRQAISLALSRDHEVQVATDLSDSHVAAAPGCDLVIIDAAALRDTSFASRLVPAVQAWKIPTIWIDETGAGQTPARDKLVVLNTPIQKDNLQAVVATCLGMSSAKQDNAKAAVTEPMTRNHETTATATQGPQVIELVDVVAEPPGRRKGKNKK